MPTLNELISDKLARLESVPNALDNSALRFQQTLLRDLLSLIQGFETSEGLILKTAENIAEIEAIVGQIEQLFQSPEYLDSITQYAREFNVQRELNNSIVARTAGEFTPDPFHAQIFRASQASAVESLIEQSLDPIINDPLRQILLESVTAGGSMADLTSALQDFAIGTPEFEGRLLRYTKQISRDLFARADRGYTEVISDDIGIKYYRYAGGSIKDTRCFCLERVGNVYHIDEIRSWGDQPNLWTNCAGNGGKTGGRAHGTNSSNIIQVLGGYNCIHSLVVVSESNVPQSVLDRTKNL